ncbi:MAG: LysR family transcriptional regulator [Dehalococcoidia bacterium]|nr:LysR family transcriptional regulator [Dehalococcoidia bacterium]
MDILLPQLRAFVAVSRLGSYARAAEELSYSEPAVYLQVKSLEKGLGLRLVRRQRKQVVLTSEGEELLPRVVEMLDRADLVAQAARGLRGRIVVASGPNTAVSWIMPIIARYQRQFPQHEVELHAGDAPGLVRDVILGNVDIAIGGIRREQIRDQSFTTHRLVLVPWVEDEWAVFGSPGLLERRASGLPGEPLRVFHYPRFTRRPLEEAGRYVKERLGRPVTLVEMGSLDLVRGAIVNELGLGIIPISAAPFLDTTRIAPVCDLGGYAGLTLRLLHRRPRLLTPPVRCFLSYLIQGRGRVRAEAGGQPARALR